MQNAAIPGYIGQFRRNSFHRPLSGDRFFFAAQFRFSLHRPLNPNVKSMEDLKNKCIQLVEAKSTQKKKNEQRSDPIVWESSISHKMGYEWNMF